MKIDFYDTAAVEAKLRQMLSPKRAIHSQNVAQAAQTLALRFEADARDAYHTGLVHDMTKALNFDAQLQILQCHGIILDDCEMQMPQIWHAISGACYLREHFVNIHEDALCAVRYHTTGRSGMSKLEKIIYLADLISAERDFEGVDNLRSLAQTDLDLAVRESLRHSIAYLTQAQKTIHKDTLIAFETLMQQTCKR